MKPERIALMPHWPARMDEGMAANYLGVSVTTLRAGSAAGRYPKPVREGGRILYARRQLDQYVDAQFGLSARSGTWDDL